MASAGLSPVLACWPGPAEFETPSHRTGTWQIVRPCRLGRSGPCRIAGTGVEWFLLVCSYLVAFLPPD